MMPRFTRDIVNGHTIILLVILSILIGTGGYVYYNNQRRIITEQAQSELSSIAQLKVHEISLWRDQRLADGRAIMDGFLSGRIWQRISAQEPLSKDRAIMTRLNSYKRAYNYKNIEISDKSGTLFFPIDEKKKHLDAYETSLVRDAVRKKQVLLSDLHKHGTSSDISIDLIVPLHVGEGRERSFFGVMLLHIDPNQFLYPQIQSWPTPSRSAETLLVRREGNEVVFLNELRHRKGTALTYRRSLTETRLPAVLAAQGMSGIIEGVDYRGERILAATMPVPDTTWQLVAKIDTEEVFASFRKSTLLISLLTVLFITGIWITIGFAWFRQRAAFYRRQYDLEAKHFEENRKSEEELRMQNEELLHAQGYLEREKEHIRKLNRTLRALSNSSHALMYATEESAYLQDICKIIVEDCGHTLVWIGYADEDEAKSVRPVAHAGFEEGYLEALRLTWADTERGRGPTGTAIRTVKQCTCGNMFTDPNFTPWREHALKRGYASCVAIPLLTGKKALGAITIYAREPDAFSEDEVNLLTELAGDLAYGITFLRMRAAHTRMENQIKLNEQRSASLLKIYQLRFDSDKELIDYAINEAVRITQSKVGYFHLFDIARQTIQLYSYSEAVWKSCTVELTPAYPLEQAGVWADSIRLRKPVIHNDYQGLADKKGYPEGHFHVLRHLSLPVFDMTGNIVAVAGVGNKEEPYEESDISQMSLYFTRVWSILNQNRMENELIKAHNELEQKVLERTQDLGKANEALTTQILERMKSEAALQESEEKYRSIFNNAIEGIYQSTPDGRFLSVNPAFARMFGYDSPEEMTASVTNIGEQLYVNPEERERWKRLLDECGVVDNFETSFYRKDKSMIWVCFSARIVTDAESNILYHEGAMEDISDRKLAEEKLSAAAHAWQTTFDAVGSAVWLLDENQRIVRANRATKDIFGKDPDELLGRFCYEVVHCTSHPIPGCPAICMRQTRQRESMELNMGERWLEVVTDPILDDTGCLLGIVHIVDDVTNRKKAEEAVKESEQLYRTFAEKSLIGTYVVQKGKYVFVSKNAAAVNGYEPAEMIGQNASALIYPEDVTLARENGIKMLKGQRTAPYEFRVITKNNDVRWILETVAPIVIDGNPAILGSYMDITEQKNKEEENRSLERQLRQAQKMEAIGTLAGGIAHDFNNILGAISGFTELTLENVPADSKANRYLKQIHSSSRRAVDLVSQILTFSRQTEKELRPLRLSPIIKEVLKLIRATTPTTIEIHQDITAEPDMVIADASYIYQVIMNLCTNANHAMQKKGGVLSVSLTKECIVPGDIDHSGFKPGTYIKLTVNDTGVGIEQGVIDRIFDPFFTTKKSGEGTGLGLSVVHGIVKSLGGEITVESRLGQGTSFHVWFPTLSERSLLANMTETEETICVRGSGRILFVDDEEMLIEMAKDMLESLGYEVTTVNKSLDALEIFRANPDRFDLIVTDQTMPEMTGMDLAQEIMRIRPDAPIILCTGFSGNVDTEKAKQAGIRDFVFKPMIKNKIANSIHRVLKKARS